MGFHLDNVSGFFILATVAIAFALKGNAPAAEVALGLTSAMGLAGPVQSNSLYSRCRESNDFCPENEIICTAAC